MVSKTCTKSTIRDTMDFLGQHFPKTSRRRKTMLWMGMRARPKNDRWHERARQKQKQLLVADCLGGGVGFALWEFTLLAG